MNTVTSKFTEKQKYYCEEGHVYLNLDSNEHYLCGQAEANKWVLICLEDGVRWKDPETLIELPRDFVEVHGTVTMEIP